jgi:transcriptional regulator with XRE-family HTH domain
MADIIDQKPSEEDIALGHRIKSIRNSYGMTQAEFANFCGIGAASQHLYESGRRGPSYRYLRRLCDLGVDMNSLFQCSEYDFSIGISEAMLKTAYVKADKKCRDSQGRLYDLGLRASAFIEEVSLLNQLNEEKSPE